MFDDCLIMAGGSGTRLWPASRGGKPKQFLPMASGETKSFFTAAVERALSLINEDGKIIIIAGKAHTPLIIEACSGLSSAGKKHLVLIPEPEAKNTAPAVACAVMYADRTGGSNRKILVLTSDHIIQPLETFKADAMIAAAFAQQDKLVVFGIPPARPETGYGYIETAGRPALPRNGEVPQSQDEPDVYSVAAFTEKPDRVTAEKFVASGRYYWNSGMFAFSAKFMISEFSRAAR
ncbi:MAG: sugar phosphate nucleotidyltransferase, partial [Treponema sp.]|nr:sugar phosphate nucleotidyltransferase [Treponema sp.]